MRISDWSSDVCSSDLLTRLICDETDRICGLVDRMEIFSDKRPINRGPVNIHQVLEHVRKIAQAGFAKHLRFVEKYDPSLPPVYGNRDRKSVVLGKSVSVRVDLGGRRILKKKNK